MKFDKKYEQIMEEYTTINELKYFDWMKKNLNSLKKKFKMTDAYWKIVVELSKIPYVMQDSDSLVIAKIGEIAEKFGTELSYQEIEHIYHVLEKIGHVAIHAGLHLLQS